MSNILGNFLKAYRKSKDLCRNEVASMWGIKPNRYWRLEEGITKLKPTIVDCKAFADQTKIDVYKIVQLVITEKLTGIMSLLTFFSKKVKTLKVSNKEIEIELIITRKE